MQEVLGRALLDIFPFLREIEARKHFEAVLAGESVVADPLPYRFAASGRRGYAQAHYSPLRDEQRQVVAGLTMIRDVTAQSGHTTACAKASAASALYSKKLPSHITKSTGGDWCGG